MSTIKIISIRSASAAPYIQGGPTEIRIEICTPSEIEAGVKADEVAPIGTPCELDCRTEVELEMDGGGEGG